ncbi:agmatinase [bacterium]|nr:agmatinase [bacterium]
MNFEKYNFIGFEADYDESEIVFVGIPYDGTASYRPGTRFAPLAIREASLGLETYSPYQDESIEDLSIHDAGDMILPFGNSERVLAKINEYASKFIDDGKKLFSVGGEHLVTYPLFEAVYKKYPDMLLIHFDAHTDLREQYLGEELSHASVIRLINRTLPNKSIYQFGIRSGEKVEFEYGKNNLNFYPFHVNDANKVLSELPNDVPIYLTVDIDVLDPSVLPGTGTPEPGGVTFLELLVAIKGLKNKNVVAIDLVELSPHYDQSGVSTITASKLVREMILLFSK